MRKLAVGIALVTLLLVGGLSAQRERTPRSKVIGKECPTLLLEEEMVQGPLITQDDFAGRIVFFLFYQRGCPGCETYAMPRLQKLYEYYKNDPCVLVLAINTAFDKDLRPYIADLERTRAHLIAQHWTMPVMRDLDEQSVELFRIAGEYGTPQAVVLDRNGIVRAHDWYYERQRIDRVERTFDKLAAGLNFECVALPRAVGATCQPAYDAFLKADYSEAYDWADRIATSGRTTVQDGADADYLKKYIEDIADDRIKRIKESFEYDPADTIEAADELIASFRGVQGVGAFAKQVKIWRASDELADFNKLRKEYRGITAEITKAGEKLSAAQKTAFQKRLQGLAKRAGATRIGTAAGDRSEGLGRGKISVQRNDPTGRVSGCGARSDRPSRAPRFQRRTESKVKRVKSETGASGRQISSNRSARTKSRR